MDASLVVTPVLGILIAIISGLALVAVCIIFVMRIKYGSGGRYQSGTHIPLQRPSGSAAGRLSDRDPDIIPSNKGRQENTNIRPTEEFLVFQN